MALGGPPPKDWIDNPSRRRLSSDEIGVATRLILESGEGKVDRVINNTALSSSLFRGSAVPSIGKSNTNDPKKIKVFCSGAPKGRLAVLREFGGKIRVFAIPSSITQLALYPLHAVLFSFFELLPSDFTHNQNRFKNLVLSGRWASNLSWSFDLKSATDLFPIALQVEILSCLFGRSFALK